MSLCYDLRTEPGDRWPVRLGTLCTGCRRRGCGTRWVINPQLNKKVAVCDHCYSLLAWAQRWLLQEWWIGPLDIVDPDQRGIAAKRYCGCGAMAVERGRPHVDDVLLAKPCTDHFREFVGHLAGPGLSKREVRAVATMRAKAQGHWIQVGAWRAELTALRKALGRLRLVE